MIVAVVIFFFVFYFQFFFTLKSSCPIASAGGAGEINTFHGTTANPSSASVNSSENQFTVIAAMPSTGEVALLNGVLQ